MDAGGDILGTSSSGNNLVYTRKSNSSPVVVRTVGRSACSGRYCMCRVRYINTFGVRVMGPHSRMLKVSGGTSNGVVAGLRYVGQGILGNSVSEPIGSRVVRRRDIVSSLVESTPF